MVESGSGATPLSWRTRIQIAIDVANALVISCLVDDVKNNKILFLEKLDSLHIRNSILILSYSHPICRSIFISIVILPCAIETLSRATYWLMKILLLRLQISALHMLQKMVLYALRL